MTGRALPCKAALDQGTVVVWWCVDGLGEGIEAWNLAETCKTASGQRVCSERGFTYLPRSSTTVSLPMLKCALCSCLGIVCDGCHGLENKDVNEEEEEEGTRRSDVACHDNVQARSNTSASLLSLLAPNIQHRQASKHGPKARLSGTVLGH